MSDADRCNVPLLVADADAPRRAALVAALAGADARVCEAASAEQARELLRDRDVALALLDVELPGLFTLLAQLREDPGGAGAAVVLLHAGGVDDTLAGRAAAAGAIGLLPHALAPWLLRSQVEAIVTLQSRNRELARRLADAERRRGLAELMIGWLTHDLRTPVMTVGLSAELVLRHGAGELLQQAGARIKASAARVSRLLEHLPNLSRAGDPLPLDLQPADLHETCAAAVAALRREHADARIEISAEGDAHGVFDRALIERAVGQLLAACLAAAGSPLRLHIDGLRADRLVLRVAGTEAPPVVCGDAERKGLGLQAIAPLVRAHGGSVVGARPGEPVACEMLLPRRADRAAPPN